MDQEDQASRWYRGLMGGKSPLQRRLEKELAARRVASPKPKRKPLRWYWWLVILFGVTVWTIVAFRTRTML